MRRLLYNFRIFSLPLMLIWIITTPLYNYLLDPYGLMSKPHHDYNTEPNLRTLKREYVSSPENSFPLLLFSNSRGGVYQIEDTGFYNMTYSRGCPEEFLDDIQYLLSKNCRIDSVILFLDETSILGDYKKHFNQPLRKIYQLDDYFSILTIPFSLPKFKDAFCTKEKTVQFFLDSDGHYEYYGFGHIKSRFDTISFNHLKMNKSNIANAETAWLNLTNFLSTHKIGYSLYVHPLAKDRVEQETHFLNDLVLLVSSLKEKGIIFQNEVVVMESDSSCFYDFSHYTPELADFVLRK